MTSWSRPLVASTGVCGWGSRQFTCTHRQSRVQRGMHTHIIHPKVCTGTIAEWIVLLQAKWHRLCVFMYAQFEISLKYVQHYDMRHTKRYTRKVSTCMYSRELCVKIDVPLPHGLPPASASPAESPCPRGTRVHSHYHSLHTHSSDQRNSPPSLVRHADTQTNT